jgi:ribosome-binding factor A
MARRSAPSHRPERVAEAIRHAVAGVLTGDLRDPRIGFVTVTGVRVSPDLEHAWVRVSVMGPDEERERTLAGLDSAAGFMRAQLAKQLRLRLVPELRFELDRGLEHGARIDRVLKELDAGEPRTDAGGGDGEGEGGDAG